MQFLDRFQRIVPNGKFFPELDGLRFLAIFTVMVFHALFAAKLQTASTNTYQDLVFEVYRNGFQGVEMFFAISGYIIGLPFAKEHLTGGRAVRIKNYLLRRVTRLEPPYIIAIFGFMVVKLVMGDLSYNEGIISFISSVFYLNGLIFNDPDFLIVLVIWSLEIEIQFYLLAIFFSKIFKLATLPRRLVFLSVIFGLPLLHQVLIFPVPTIYNFLQYFFIGFLLVDLHLTHKKIELSKYKELLLGFIALIPLLYINHEDSLISEYAFISGLLVLYYLTLFGKTWKKIFSVKLISVIGGMCYSIYLMHFPLFSFFSRFAEKLQISGNITIDLIFISSILIVFALVISAIFFLLIEKPCMDKDWPKKLKGKLMEVKYRFSS